MRAYGREHKSRAQEESVDERSIVDLGPSDDRSMRGPVQRSCSVLVKPEPHGSDTPISLRMGCENTFLL